MGRSIMLLCLSLTIVSRSAEGAVRITVKEGSDVVLPCSLSSKENLESKLFDWKKDAEKYEEKRVFMYDAGLYSGRDFDDQDQQFKGRISLFQDELKNGNASIKITQTKVSDSGNYSCILPRLQPKQTFHIEVVVEAVFKDRSAENNAASSKPYISALHQTQDKVLLLCEVQGVFPEPKLEWQDSSGNILPPEGGQLSLRGDKYFITLQTTVTKTGNYSCVLRQEGLKHEIASLTFVYFHGKEAECPLAPVAVGCLAAGALILATSLFLTVKTCPMWCHKVIDYLSGLKPQRDPQQQNRKCEKSGSTLKDVPFDPPDASSVLLSDGDPSSVEVLR